MLAQGIRIRFAHRTFKWTNEAPGKAAVHCVIIGFGMEDVKAPRLFEYDDIKGAAHEVAAKNINPYLVDAPTVVLPNRRSPICNVSEMIYGSKPTDGGNLLLSDDEKNELLAAEPDARPWIRRFLGAEELLNDVLRWCLWLNECPPQTLDGLPRVRARVQAVAAMRRASAKQSTRNLASTPALFGEDRQGTENTLVVPAHSSELRQFVPMGYFDSSVIIGNANFMIPNATIYEFGILSSTMHNAWVRYTCGRLESRYRYSAGIVYNNYPWPQEQTDKQREVVSVAAQGVLDARAVHQNGKTSASLADLYNPTTMPANLSAAHKALDKAVDSSYGKKGMKTDSERVAYLFTLYNQYTSLLP
jgi:hypothetical protein